jgi:hypothetical protein
MTRTISSAQTWFAEHDPLQVIALPDVVIDAVGFPADSTYAETYWLPILGPSSLWLLRRMCGWLELRPDGVAVPHVPLAGELGLGHAGGRNSALIRTLARLVAFDMATITGEELAVRRRVPPLARRHLLRLPPHLVELHAADVSEAQDALAGRSCA